MEYRKLGRSGLRVSAVSLGSWITLGYKVDAQKTAEIVRTAFDLGVNFYDTADVYSGGEAERVLGSALSHIPRKDYVLASKCYFPSAEGPNDRGLSRKHIMESCHASLKRLSVDYLDLYQCHRFDPDTPTEETMRALSDLIRQGKILYAGVSEWTAEQIVDACHLCRSMNLDPLVSNQPVYNMLERKIEPEILPACAREGIGNIVFSPLAQGVLTGKYAGGTIPKDSRAADKNTEGFIQRYLDEKSLSLAKRVAEVAKSYGATSGQFALRWCLRRPELASVIIGVTSATQLRENIAAMDLELPPSVFDEFEESSS